MDGGTNSRGLEEGIDCVEYIQNVTIIVVMMNITVIYNYEDIRNGY